MVPLARSNHDSDLGDNPALATTSNQDVRNLYQDVLDRIEPSVYDVVFGGDWLGPPGIADHNDPHRRDFHPTPLEHVKYLDTVMPGHVTDDTREWMSEADSKARANELDWREPNRPLTRL